MRIELFAPLLVAIFFLPSGRFLLLVLRPHFHRSRFASFPCGVLVGFLYPVSDPLFSEDMKTVIPAHKSSLTNPPRLGNFRKFSRVFNKLSSLTPNSQLPRLFHEFVLSPNVALQMLIWPPICRTKLFHNDLHTIQLC